MVRYNMSEFSGVIILTIFRAFSTGSRKAVDNPAPLRACELRQICLLQENRDHEHSLAWEHN
jgi:hypothetical protein